MENSCVNKWKQPRFTHNNETFNLQMKVTHSTWNNMMKPDCSVNYGIPHWVGLASTAACSCLMQGMIHWMMRIWTRSSSAWFCFFTALSCKITFCADQRRVGAAVPDIGVCVGKL